MSGGSGDGVMSHIVYDGSSKCTTSCGTALGVSVLLALQSCDIFAIWT